MAKHVLIALTSPVEGKEAEYNSWYNEVHIPEILSVPGITSARRFRIKVAQIPGAPASKYVAIYEVETDNLGATLKALGEVTSEVIEALDQSTSGTVVAKEIFSLLDQSKVP
jgi:hypothetical protein